jgi:N-carbamoylputrescine amidase
LPSWPSNGSTRSGPPSAAFASSPSPRRSDRDGVRQKAKELGIVTVINLYERDGQHTYDSSPVIDADGTLLGVTRMIHITEYPCFHEQGYYTPGDKGLPVYRRKPARSACRSVTTVIFPNTCARWRLPAPIL